MKNFSTEQGCVACNLSTENGSALHHIYTRKARQDLQYSPWNMIPVCFKCHAMFHAKGTNFMAYSYGGVRAWLHNNDWEYHIFLNKWVHPKAFKQPECHEEEVGGD